MLTRPSRFAPSTAESSREFRSRDAVRHRRRWPHACVVGAVLVAAFALSATASADEPAVTAPPEAFFDIVSERHRDVARDFYGKYIEADGLPIVAHHDVADEALIRSREIVVAMLAGRPDVLAAMAENQMYLIIIGRYQNYTDMPEYRLRRNPDYLNERVRGTGGRPTSFGEENVLRLPLDRYDDESIAVHEFAHTIDSTLRTIQDDWPAAKEEAYRNAVENGLWEGAYAQVNSSEYFAELVQQYFDADRANNWNHNHVATREQLRAHDPMGYQLVRQTFNLPPERDWRYEYIRQLPNVTAPPQRWPDWAHAIEIDPYYTRFSYARELPVVGREASDAAMLAVNHTIRRMFAYRHDIIKAFIDDDARVVVLGADEHLADLPEYETWREVDGFDPLVRSHAYIPETSTFIVAEENVLADPRDPHVGDQHVVDVFARSIYTHLGRREQQEPYGSGGGIQQYEIDLTPIDQRFAASVREAYEQAMEQDMWRGTPSMLDPEHYWAYGVLAYFDATGQQATPTDARAHNPINSREALRNYDPALYELVHETMNFENRVDWRFEPFSN